MLPSRIGGRIRSVARGPAALRLRVLRQNGVNGLAAYARPASGTAFDSKDAPRATLVLEDGTRLPGYSFGADRSSSGEVVFTTGMVGYPESLTDPSYRGQILTLTYPLGGNYGVPSRDDIDELGLQRFFESDRIHVEGLVLQDYSHKHSHWNAASSLRDWLREENVPAIHGIDTRLLTKKIRDSGAMLGKIVMEGDDVTDAAPFISPYERNLVAEVSIKEPKVYGQGNSTKILAVHGGMKNNMIRMLVERDCEVKVVPWDHDLAAEREWYDGLFLSNGPGDPQQIMPLVDQVRGVLNHPDGKDKPIFGICLGNQVVGMAAGCSTYKLPFGNRGQNQPVHNLMNGEVFITPQNHGFAINAEELPDEWEALFTNTNDGSNEGIKHKTKPFFTAQFHPEAKGGPIDTEFLFDMFLDTVRTGSTQVVPARRNFVTPERPEVKKVLVLGSGGLSIGQAGEFDYSGSQAIKALKEEGIETVLMNPNIASVQTNTAANLGSQEAALKSGAAKSQADNVFFLPVTPEFVTKVIERERPDGILISMGGQTALNVGVELQKRGVFEQYGVHVLGTPISSVVATEDRDIFSDKLKEIGEKLAQSIAVDNVEDAVLAAEEIKYPVMIRSAYALGGLGSGICEDEAELRDMAAKAFSVSPQVLVERSLKGWKEVEYEVVRDAADNCITVCNMENFDPLGIHTGESIVVAPSQTLSNEEYHMLRRTAINVVRHIGIVGECNIQYALDPESLDYCIIEVNARLSRSSALASKATGYPLAAVAAKLGLGITLPEIKNAVTRETSACFEPSLDYIVTKIPRWDLTKFEGVAPEIGSAMKSVGEVMAIGRSFEESLQKALRMVDPTIEGFEPRMDDWTDPIRLHNELVNPTDLRIAALAYALRNGTHTVEQLHDLTKIDLWFLYRLQRITEGGARIQAAAEAARDDVPQDDPALLQPAGDLGYQASRVFPQACDAEGAKALQAITAEDMRLAKFLGFSDRQLARRVGLPVTGHSGEGLVRQHRQALGVTPVVKQIDTLAAEYPAQTNYLYTTYAGSEHDVSFGDQGTLVLGSGTYRIGSSVEFDWCSVSAIRTLRELGRKSVVVNYNPETVSTDYDECDRLYFEELSLERVMDIYEAEQSNGVIVSVGGQIPNNLALPLHRLGAKVLGTSPERIDNAEDRARFSQLMDDIGVDQPAWSSLKSMEEALAFAEEVTYPVLVRPSYVLSGAAMKVAYNQSQLLECLGNASAVSPEHPVVLTKFVEGANEIEFDGVAKNGEVVAHAVSEHVEKAGVHSGDATLVLPPNLSEYYVYRSRDIAARVAKALDITGPFNMQLLAKGADVSIIECNLRASRSFPFVSKTVGADFIRAATMAMLDEDVSGLNLPSMTGPVLPRNFVGIKAPMFSFPRLRGADPVLGVEMASTGEVACFGATRNEAFLKALLATHFRLPSAEKGILVSVQEDLRDDAVEACFALQRKGFPLYATDETYEFLRKHSVDVKLLPFPEVADDTPAAVAMAGSDLVRAIRDNDIDLVVNLHNPLSKRKAENYAVRRSAVDYNVPLITNTQVFRMFADAIAEHAENPMVGLDASSLFDYYTAEKNDDAWTAPTEFH